MFIYFSFSIKCGLSQTMLWLLLGSSSIKLKDDKSGSVYSVGAENLSSASPVLSGRIVTFLLLLFAMLHRFTWLSATIGTTFFAFVVYYNVIKKTRAGYSSFLNIFFLFIYTKRILLFNSPLHYHHQWMNFSSIVFLPCVLKCTSESILWNELFEARVGHQPFYFTKRHLLSSCLFPLNILQVLWSTLDACLGPHLLVFFQLCILL